MEVKLKQISTVVDKHDNMIVFAIDEHGNFWQWMRGQWGKMKNPVDNSQKKAEPGIKVLD